VTRASVGKKFGKFSFQAGRARPDDQIATHTKQSSVTTARSAAEKRGKVTMMRLEPLRATLDRLLTDVVLTAQQTHPKILRDRILRELLLRAATPLRANSPKDAAALSASSSTRTNVCDHQYAGKHPHRSEADDALYKEK
jgi:hypothetical protein